MGGSDRGDSTGLRHEEKTHPWKMYGVQVVKKREYPHDSVGLLFEGTEEGLNLAGAN